MLLLTGVALCLIAGTNVLLVRTGARQHLGAPGVKTHPIPGSIRLQADLPERVGNYTSEPLAVDDVTFNGLPADTSFGMRRYKGPDDFTMDLRVVLMGHDRTSLHRPQFCLTGQGWRIDDVASGELKIQVKRPFNYELPVIKLFTRMNTPDNKAISGVYVYWYVADDAVSGSALGLERMWWIARELVSTGVLQRWAYVSCFASCAPGQEQATFERIKGFITEAVPQFQLYPRDKTAAMAGSPSLASVPQ